MKIILVVEDEHLMQQLIQTNLERAGYGVLQAMTGYEGLASVETQRPDLILLDMTLPDMTTVEFAPLLKRNPSNRSIPVFILSPPPEESEVYQGGWDGIAAYLHKPFDPIELLSLVKRIFEETV
ncbi:MAG: Response regulator consisting of a CheY-like receiver domain and a winged-helix DNA-binding domain [Chthonomonadales bacterium]|nr:Response regulator consisting of a CheY-like receiver domain and a winged-helix DNA-binding domain [Chthonomonadales bacterium]